MEARNRIIVGNLQNEGELRGVSQKGMILKLIFTLTRRVCCSFT